MVLTIIDSTLSYVDVIGKARQKISLEVESTLIRRAATDGLIIQVSEEDNARKAEKLAALKRVFKDENKVKMYKPTQIAELRLSGLDITKGLQEKLSKPRSCLVNEVTVDRIRTSAFGLDAV